MGGAINLWCRLVEEFKIGPNFMKLYSNLSMVLPTQFRIVISITNTNTVSIMFTQIVYTPIYKLFTSQFTFIFLSFCHQPCGFR